MASSANPDQPRRDQSLRPLSRDAPTWVPAAEVRGEGIFIAFEEAQLDKWLDRERSAQTRARFLCRAPAVAPGAGHRAAGRRASLACATRSSIPSRMP